MLPLVAIVGRPNVGKSTLFNRLVGRKSALVANEPGLTRDRHYGRAEWERQSFDLVDTGGFESDAVEGGLEALIRAQTETAIEEADVVILVWDVRDGPTTADGELVNILRRSGKPVLYVANKVDGPRQEPLVPIFYELGIEEILAVSAEHGLGMDDFIDRLLERIPLPIAGELSKDDTDQGDGDLKDDGAPLKLALVGRPNAGKSALLNRLLGEERSIVSDMPGTTRDPVDAELEIGGKRYLLIDTAGIRKKQRSGPLMEQISVLRALRAVTQADIACLLIDGEGEVAAQDARIANMALDAGRGLLLIFSKSDLLGSRTKARRRIETMIADHLYFVDYAPYLLLSAKTGAGVDKVLPKVRAIQREAQRRFGTAELNRLLEALVAAHSPPAFRGRSVRLYYITQAQTAPPTFIVSVNHVQGVPKSYRRYVLNRLRAVYGFEGVPLRVFYRAHREVRESSRPRKKSTKTDKKRSKTKKR